MFKANYKAALKSILRSPLILISFGATIIVAYSVYTATSHTAPGEITPLYALRQQFWNHSASTCKMIFAPLIGLLISAYILSDIRNGFSDLMVSSSKSLLSSYLSKLCAIGTVAFVARWIVLGACLVWFWNVHYPIEFVPDGAVLPLKDILIGYVASETVFVPFLLLCYIAMPTFVCIITNISASGAVWNVCFYLFGSVLTPFQYTDFCLVPFSVWRYYRTFDHIDDPQHMAEIQAGLIVDSMGKIPPTFAKALSVYVGWIVFSLALLVAAYFILKRRYRT